MNVLRSRALPRRPFMANLHDAPFVDLEPVGSWRTGRTPELANLGQQSLANLKIVRLASRQRWSSSSRRRFPVSGLRRPPSRHRAIQRSTRPKQDDYCIAGFGSGSSYPLRFTVTARAGYTTPGLPSFSRHGFLRARRSYHRHSAEPECAVVVERRYQRTLAGRDV